MLKRTSLILVSLTLGFVGVMLILCGAVHVTRADAASIRATTSVHFPAGELPQPSGHDSGDAEWTIERVDAPRIFGEMRDRSLALDKDGNPHIAYGKDHLYYAWYDGFNWWREKVDDSPGVGRYTSIALDDGGNPHISYYDTIMGSPKYAHKNGSGWDIQVVDSDPYISRGEYTSLALDSAGNPHIAYSAQYSGVGARYAKLTGSGWEIETVDTTGRKGISMALEPIRKLPYQPEYWHRQNEERITNFAISYTNASEYCVVSPTKRGCAPRPTYGPEIAFRRGLDTDQSSARLAGVCV